MNDQLRFISLFSGIGGFDLGLERAGMRCVAQVERDEAALRVLAQHWPDVPRFKDVRDVGRSNLPAADLICGGFPCQDVSVAGRCAGLAGERSGLWFEFHRILAEIKPQWVVIENVPGLLSSNNGADFAVVLRGLVECGYRVGWRILDAQNFGVAQRRRRVFIVGNLGDGCAAQVLFERESSAGHPQPGSSAGKRTAAPITASTPSRRNGSSSPTDGAFIYAEQRSDTFADASVASTLASRDAKGVRTVIASSKVMKTLTRNYGKQADNSNSSTPSNFVIVAPLSASGAGTARTGNERNEAEMLVIDTQQVTSQANRSQPSPEAPPLTPHGQPIVFNWNAGAGAGLSSGALAPTLRASGHTSPAVAGITDTLYNKGIKRNEDEQHASAQKTDTRTLLRILRQKAGEEAFTEWGLGILDSLQQAQVLRPPVYGKGIRRAASEGQSAVDDSALPRTEDSASRFVREVWITECVRRASQRWGLDEQQSRQLGEVMSQLSQPGTPQTQALRDLWETSEGLGVLRQALSAFQKIRRSDEGQSQPVQRGFGVRRLTPQECERLQSFPDHWTAFGADGIPQSDSARYKQLGNAVCVNVSAWIGQRIVQLEAQRRED